MTSAASATFSSNSCLSLEPQREVLEAVALELARVGVAQDLDGDRLGGRLLRHVGGRAELADSW